MEEFNPVEQSTEVQEEQATEKPQTVTKKDLQKKVIELTEEVNQLKQENSELIQYVKEQQQYIEKLYENSNNTLNKIEAIRAHVKSINKLSAIYKTTLGLIDERMEIINRLLSENPGLKGE